MTDAKTLFIGEHTSQFPHCDTRVLHAPGECEYCDRHPQWQALRMAWGIAFTGHDPDPNPERDWLRELPCPADFNRPKGAGNDHRGWGGNVARPVGAKPVGSDWAGYEVTEADPRYTGEYQADRARVIEEEDRTLRAALERMMRRLRRA